MPSMYNKEKNAAFLHFIKTGGWWVKNLILDKCNFKDIDLSYNGGHVGAREIKNIADDIFTFGFIRHPISWHISLFNYLTQYDWLSYNPKSGFLHLRSNSIDEFIEKTIFDGIKMTDYYHQFFDIGGLNECKFIGKHETIYDDMKYILDILKLPNKDLIEDSKNFKVNESAKYFRGKLNSKSVDLIVCSCEEIFKKFKYQI